jgi:hypothetical protein
MIERGIRTLGLRLNVLLIDRVFSRAKVGDDLVPGLVESTRYHYRVEFSGSTILGLSRCCR